VPGNSRRYSGVASSNQFLKREMPMQVFLIMMMVFVAGVYFWMNRKPAVEYNPAKEDILILLRKVVGGMNTELEWSTFLGVPIANDATLEEIRKKCAAIEENLQNSKDIKEGFMVNESGIMEIKKMIVELEGYCIAQGRSKTEFQVNCAQILEHKMEQLGLKFASWGYVDGAEESYYLGEFKGMQIYVYEDGASVKSPYGSYMYEKQQYKSESELTRVLIGKVTEMATSMGAQ
jgi:hypothetical protein